MEEKIKEAYEEQVKTEEKVPEKQLKADKLTTLKAKHEKAAAAVEKAAKKEKAIREEIAAEEQKIHDKEIKQLDGICKSMKISLADVIRLIEIISENNITVSEAAELIGGIH